MVDFYERVLSVLQSDPRFFAEDGTFLRNAVYEAAMQMDADLLRRLLGDEELSRRFFAEVDGIRIFDKMKFAWVINNRQFLPDSYTRFKNKIGLGEENGELLSASGNVELVFPYKDCVLEGGQTKEEARRQEIFYNETLAPDEVDRLLEPKVLTGAKRYTAQGVQETDTWSEEDNLILKGNNLLALSSLLKRYEGKIKCIYIDPPYYFTAKKGEDTFAYNSNFKLSTWLVFMKNRLEIARRLLRKDGAIFVQISDDGVAELKCLMKDIFCRNGENNFINQITVKTKSPSGFASVNPGVFETAEYILAFAKNKRLWKYHPQYVKSEYDSNYKWLVTNPDANPSDWNIVDLFAYVAQQKGYASRKEAVKALGEAAFLNLVERCALDHAESVFRTTAIDNSAGQEIVQAREQSREDRDRIFTVERDGHYRVFILNGAEMAFYSRKVREIDGERVPSTQLTNIWTDTPYEGIAKEGGVQLKGGKKPEKLVRRILEMATAPGDLVLDFYMGSGTTCAVAHKLGRRYIGVEQLDGQLEKALTRLPAVIAGEQTGISKALGWKGGGSFVCCELAKLNQAAVEAKVVHYTRPHDGGVGVPQSDVSVNGRDRLDLAGQDWFAYADNYGTSEEKAFVAHFYTYIDRFRQVYQKVVLIRNERMFHLYSFEEGKRFEPDYVLILQRETDGGLEQIQVLIEPKGNHLLAEDAWKEAFLLSLEQNSVAVGGEEDGCVRHRIVGLHFFNEDTRKREFDQDLENLLKL